MKIPLVDLNAQYKTIKKEIEPVIKDVLSNSKFINGEANNKFDEEFAKYCGVKYSIGVGSGSVALDFALQSLGIGMGDEVICPSHTFTATGEAIVHLGAKPVFVDINDTYNIDPNLIERKINKKTKAIIAVHMYGNPADMVAINKIAKKHKIFVVEDAAQAHGALLKNKKIGSIGDVACFSFFPAKNLGCYGDGGAVVTNSKKIADKIVLLKDHGRFDKYNHLEIGFGGRLDNLQAAILRLKLKHLDEWNKKRNKIAKKYNSLLSKNFQIPPTTPNAEAVYYVYTLRHPKRGQIIKFLKEKGISTNIYYPYPLHLLPAYKYLGYKKGDLPETEKACLEIFSIPMFPELTDRQINYITKTLLSFK
jgi:dTDP-4-amino-4,6-dideoxygalactose transaminase